MGSAADASGADRRTVSAALVLAAIAAVHPGREARADEGGASFWLPGQSAANLAATLPSPGWSLPVTFYYYAGRAPRSAADGGAVAPGTRSSTSQLSLAPTYVLPAPVLGGQLTGDSGSGNTCGPCKSRVAGIGPQLNYAFDVAGREWSANLRGYDEFRARNRLQGYAVFASAAMPM